MKGDVFRIPYYVRLSTERGRALGRSGTSPAALARP